MEGFDEVLQGLDDLCDLRAHCRRGWGTHLHLLIILSLGVHVPFKPLTAGSGQRVNELRCMELKGNEND